MPAYDMSLWDFLKCISTQPKHANQVEDFFPLSDRIDMAKRICDGLLYMNNIQCVAHRDIKPRPVSEIFCQTDTIC